MPSPYPRDQAARSMDNREITLLASAARTADVNTADIVNYGYRGVVVVIDATVDPGTASVVFTIQGKSSLDGNYYTILASAAVDSVTTRVLRVYPDLTASANLIADDVLPRIWRVNCDHADTESITYSVNALPLL